MNKLNVIFSIVIMALTIMACGETVNDIKYEEKITITFTDTTQVFHGSNVRLSTGAIYIDDCKEVNNNKLIIEYHNVKYYYREDIK